MEKIASKLIEFGMDFNYESNGSQGEEIVSFELSVKISRQQGKLFFEYEGEMETLEDDDRSMSYVLIRLDEIIIEETT